MTKVYIDTNIFLDFYQSSKDRLSVFEEIKKHSPSIVLTEQTVHEFNRNRISRLSELIRNIEKTSAVRIHTTALVQSLPEFKEWNEAKKNAEKMAKDISKQLTKWIHDTSSDPVNVAFEQLVLESTLFHTTVQSIEKAKTRKLIGNPPTSPDKHTIGDELIWETMLEFCREDLIVVSRDKTFLENAALLKNEYEKLTEATLVTITSSLAEAFKQIGEPSDAVIKAEKEIDESKEGIHYPFPLTLKTKCPKCNGDLEETGYEGSDGDSAWWVYCTQCNSDFFPNQFTE